MEITISEALNAEDLAGIAEIMAVAFARKVRTVRSEELVGVAWEGAQRALERADRARAPAEVRAYVTRGAWNAMVDEVLRSVPESADGLEQVEAPGASRDVFETLQAALDEAGVEDPLDRQAALAEWAGSDPVEEARVVTEKRLPRVRRKLRGVL